MRSTIAKLMAGLVILVASIAFIGCNQPSTPVPEEPPAPIILDWMDVVPDGFFQLTQVDMEVTGTQTIRSAGSIFEISDVYIVFQADGEIAFWYDHESNGILEPEDYLGSGGTWVYIDGQLEAEGEIMDIQDVQENLWSMILDISDEFEDCLGEAGYEVTGTALFTYERAYPTYMTDEDLIVTDFPFAFSDRNETGLSYTLRHTYSWWCQHYYLESEEILIDEFDGFLFSWGDEYIVLVTEDAGDRSYIIVDGNLYAVDVDDNPFVFAEDAVYDMTITVQPNNVAYFEFVSRLDSSDTFTVPAEIAYDALGAITILAVDDVGGLVL